jgi:uncharacterized surface protein with fasciclin (FAS1) repeats
MPNIIDTVFESPDFTTLATAIKEGDLVATLSGAGPFTLFAPTNEAFEKIPEETLEEVLEDKEKLKKILTYHVLSTKVMAKDIAGKKDVATVQGDKLTVDILNGTRVNDAKITKADIECDNGVIHVIDTVLMPQ